MIQEEKAKAYDEALERARKLYNDAITLQLEQDIKDYEQIFPELKESEDERIRKALIENFELLNGKQFKNQKWGAHEELLIDDILSWLEKQGEQKPITIDIDKMVNDYANNKERGNEDFGKPVPCMIRAYRQGLNDAIGKVVLKPAWSEDDDDAWMNDIISKVENNLQLNKAEIDWLKSLRPQNRWKPNDEQMKVLEELVEDNNQRYFYTILRSLYEQLKKLREE